MSQLPIFAIYLRKKPVCHSNLRDPSVTVTTFTLEISKKNWKKFVY